MSIIDLKRTLMASTLYTDFVLIRQRYLEPHDLADDRQSVQYYAIMQINEHIRKINMSHQVK